MPESEPQIPADSNNTAPVTGEKVVSPEVAAPPRTFWQRARFIAKVIEIRLRFALILLATFVLIGKWDTIKNHWDKFTRPADEHVHNTSDVEYYCPMHPSVVRDSLEPDGSQPKCPICSMPLSIRRKGARDVNSVLPRGVIERVQLSPERIRMAGIATAPVAYRPLEKEIDTVGFVAYDESRKSRVVTRTAGYLNKLFVNKSFQQVAAGEPVALIYSPELYGSQQDLALALDRGAADLVDAAKERLKLLGVEPREIDALVASQMLLAALKQDDRAAIAKARQRLTELGMTATEIERIIADRKVESGLLIRSPVTGHVISKEVEEGAHVEAGATLLQVADLSTVWIEAELYESEVGFVHAGQLADVAIEGLPNQIFHGKIALVHPHVEPATRTSRVRIELPNPEHLISPGMYATVTLKTPFQDIEPFKTALAAARRGPAKTDDVSLIAFQKTCPVTGNKLGDMGPPVKRSVAGKSVFLCCSACNAQFDKDQHRYLAQFYPPPGDGVLTVPERAVIDTGKKKVVYLEREPGVFDGVEVEVGPLAGGSYPVVKGLAPGDRVAAAGAFLIDAEARLNPSVASKAENSDSSPSGPAKTDPAAKVAGKSSPQAEPAIDLAALERPDADALANLEHLAVADQKAARDQQVCPITGAALGSMGIPVKIELAVGKAVFLCCNGCRDKAKADPDKVARKLAAIAEAKAQQPTQSEPLHRQPDKKPSP